MRPSSPPWLRVSLALMFSIGPMAMSLAARAQEAPAAPAAGPEDVPPAMPAQPAAPPPAPAPPVTVTVAPAADAPRAEADFDVEERRWAIGYAGVSVVPTGTSALTIPAVGLRYWTSPTVGIDAALGVGWIGGSTDMSGTTTDKNASLGIIAQGGVPLVLSAHRHVTFQVIPFLTVAYGRTSSGTGTAEIDYDGLRVDVGARAGFELFFGFIGIPELALSATVGLQFEYLRNAQSPSGLTGSSDTTYTLSTTVQNNPWDIFAGNVAARYYF
jgi:hypothetical protein